MLKKICTKCKELKSLNKFYKHKTYKNGRKSECKECAKTRGKEYHKKNLKKNHIRNRKYYKKNAKEITIKHKEWHKNNFEKIKTFINIPEEKKKNTCRFKTNYLVRTNQIKKQPCKICGNPRSEAHHSDYNNPLKIIWLCRKHHTKLHNKLRNK